MPIRDIKKNFHYIECHGLEEITKDPRPIHPRKYRKIFDKFGIKPSEVKWPDVIHCMISTKSNHLMSDKVVKRIDGLKLYSGPLGKTISGNVTDINEEQPQVYLNSSDIKVTAVKKRKMSVEGSCCHEESQSNRKR